ncbi:putative Integral membrane protein [Seiridium unicorne]|uniref:Integral membrane protein n=1 Tax=Seiridium unicorne TaxID=138068 RepID=A0ABR2UGB7_9PEZI
MLILNLIAFTGFLASQFQGWRHGLGKHESQLSPEDRRAAYMWFLISFLLYTVSVCLFKIALGLFLLRVVARPLHIQILRSIIIGSFVVGISYFCLVLFQCKPASTWWLEGPRTPGKCWDDKVVLGMDIAASITNCMADWALGVLPIFVVKSLNIQRRTTFIRTFYIPRLVQNTDFLYAVTEVAYLSTVESGIGITAVSLGTLQPLFTQLGAKRAVPQPMGYVKVHGRDNAPRSRSRSGSMASLVKSSESSFSNTQPSFSHQEANGTVHATATDTTATGVGAPMELVQLNEQGGIGHSVEASISKPSPAMLHS